MKKSILIGISLYIFGFIFVIVCTTIFNSDKNVEHSYYYAIIFSILYLCSIVGVSTSLILKELRKE
jgi:vacuolar-type H+-ATPase subunit I/STV1